MGDEHGEHRSVINKATSRVPRRLSDSSSENEESNRTYPNYFAEVGLTSAQLAFGELKASPEPSRMLHPYDNCDGHHETALAVTPVPSPEIPRRESHNFSICEENFLSNVQPVTNLATSPRISSHEIEISPISPCADRNHATWVYDIQIEEEFLQRSESGADDPEGDNTSNHDADTEDGSDRSSQINNTCVQLPVFHTSNTSSRVIGSLSQRDPHPTPHPRKKLSSCKLTVSVDALDFEESRSFIPIQESLVAENSDTRSKSTSDVCMSKASVTTRSAPDISRAFRARPTKPIPFYPKPDYSKVESKVRQYKKTLAALSTKPRVQSPTTLSADSPVFSSDPMTRSTHAIQPKATSADNVIVAASSLLRSSTRVVAKSTNYPKVPPTTTVGTQTVPETYSEAQWISRSLKNSQYEPVVEYIQDLWDKFDLSVKEKRMYEEAYKNSEKNKSRLELQAAHYRQMAVEALRTRRLLRLQNDWNDDIVTPERKMSSVSSSSGWITSSSSDSHLHSSSPGGEAVDAVLYNEATLARSKNTFTADVLIHSNATAESSQATCQRESSMASLQGVKPPIVMGVQHKIALAKNVTTRRKQTLDEKELERLAAFAFAPLAQGHKRTFQDEKAVANIGIDPGEDFAKSTSKLPAQNEDGDGYPRHISKIMWMAGFFLNKTATAIVPEAQDRLNLSSPKEFFYFRKLRWKMLKGGRPSVGKNTARSSVSSVASSQTSLSSRLRAKFRFPSVTPKNRRRSKSCERLQIFDD